MADWGVTLSGVETAEANIEALEDTSPTAGHVVKSDVEYSVYVEFGTRHMAANGALRASVSETMANLGRVVGDADTVSEITEAIAEDIAEGWRDNVWVDTGRLKNSITVERR